MEASLRNRLVFGVTMLATLGGLLYLDWALQQWTISDRFPTGVGGIGLLVICLFLLPAATHELASLFAAVQVKPYRIFSAIGSSALALHAFLTQFPGFRPYGTTTLALIVVSTMILAALRRAWGRETRDAIHNMAGTVLATLYLGGLAWFLIALRVKNVPEFRGSTMVILTVLLIVKATDIGAFFGGRKFGKHKLIFWLSPGKTWEGLFFGVMTSALVGAACARWLPNFVWWEGMIFGAVIGAIGQAGDLLESMMKRDAAVKDSGASIPGFGGILDVIDSPLLAAPFAYLMFSIFARQG